MSVKGNTIFIQCNTFRDANRPVRSVSVRSSSVYGSEPDRGLGPIGPIGLRSGPRSHKKNFSLSRIISTGINKIQNFLFWKSV
uniref:Uncharacterized protein n=1 Tax=Rhizophagus irregularis (strain DAOM 181602 / DAOM 197198 / MUCL 43194) TaxID=747089 RepID=U9UDY6_RHIID